MSLKTDLNTLHRLEKEMHAYSHASSLIYYDAFTSAPRGASDTRSETLEVLGKHSYSLITRKSTGALLDRIYAERETLSPSDRRAVYLLKRDRRDTERIPVKEYIAFNRLTNEAETVWHKAKAESDFPMFAPYLEKLFDSCIRLAGYIDPEKDPYDVWLDKFEPGLNRRRCDGFFSSLREKLVPLIRRVGAAKAPDTSFLDGYFDPAKQAELSDYLMRVIGIDGDYCTLRETEHPFTINFSKQDVRITTHYYPDNLLSAMYSTIHEGGHALYELHTADEFMYTPLGGGVSMAIHESQSRFFENIIGRSLPFITYIMPKLRELFPEKLSSVSAEDFWRAANKSEPSLIRTEADELTYSLHIMIRYELEKALFDRRIKVSELPGEWNRLYREYLGVEPTCDREGVLQDSHWSGANIGYFPSYSLGSAYGAQLLRRMKETVDVSDCLEKGNIAPINHWLCERIWNYGSLLEPVEVFEKAAGEKFDPDVFVSYLEAKYTKLYNL